MAASDEAQTDARAEQSREVIKDIEDVGLAVPVVESTDLVRDR